MSDSRPSASPSRGLWVLIILLLVPPIVLPLWVPLYDKVEPRLNGWPFFFWFQMALIVVAVGLTGAAYFLAKSADRAARVRHGLTPEPPADQNADGEADR